ncbi:MULTISPECIES: hypothetical protein [unclassified Arthrobacter]|uniref:hypothetical protein n=1 Tax=unclassified Arthrobacter TaxID=235627 RepID=UPI0014916C1A|nr:MULTISPECIES: hypothetical protein [unclassified Arthrobacter]MBE0010823.1 hypothetical protein [Arthrobacter sp. AET 35A]NOJ60473.1 hypothetical protein [Arthrobacter sp. 260]NOJ64610.1 hypothetical protein [Arthrobacter sp. 147(2020)]
METQRFRLRGPSLEALRSQAFAEHGPEARITSAELVTIGGIRGFFAQRHYEVTVEVPPMLQVPPRTGRRSAGRPAPAPRRESGIAALLAEADDAEASLHGVQMPEPLVSTDSNLFAALMDDLIFNTDAATKVTAKQPSPVPIPSPATRPGDLTVVVGLGADPLGVARSMAEELVADRHRRSAVRALGDPGAGSGFGGAGATASAGFESRGRRAAGDSGADDALGGSRGGQVTDRMAAAALRAAGVEGGFPVFVAVGLEAVGQGASGKHGASLATVAALGADQVWIVVDASRKPLDTAAWVTEVADEVSVTALAVVATAATSSPESVNTLGIPVGWVDGRRASSPVL